MATPTYSHDGEVIVFNYQTRTTMSNELAAVSLTSAAGQDPLATDRVSLREAIISVQCSKNKANPQGTFMITLKPTREWTEIIVPGSWCAIFMKDSPITDADLTNALVADVNVATNTTNQLTPLKMIGVVMSVRVNKKRQSDGSFTLTYTIAGYDFGYSLLSSIYVNYALQPEVAAGKLKAPFSQINIPQDQTIIGDPAINVARVLSGWSVMSSQGVPGLTALGIPAPPIRMKVPDDVAKFVNSGNEILQFISTAIGIDQRGATDKSFTPGDNGDVDEFSFELLGQKEFQAWEIVNNNTLWGMINQYMNPLLNEAYCDLHATKNADGSVSLRPALIVRQIPFNTPDYDTYWATANAQFPGQKADKTLLVDVPRTALPPEKVLEYDIGYSEYERVNFVEINALDKGIAKQSGGAFNDINRPKFEEGSITRFGLRPKVYHGVDYGAVKGNIQESGAWSPLYMDWWFNCNKYASGTIECIGLMEHIAVGENMLLVTENILGHIESYNHTLTVDKDTGTKTFRTSIDFTRGIKGDSTASQYNYIYGDATVNNQFAAAAGIDAQSTSIFDQDVNSRVTFKPLGNQTTGTSPATTLNSLTDFIKLTP